MRSSISNKRLPPVQSRQAGFTLIEMAIILLIIGLVTGAFFAFYGVMHENEMRNNTILKQRTISFALTAFAQSHGRLPCPGRPNDATRGYPRLFDQATNFYGTCAALTDRTGIVPYRLLGLTEAQVTDSWGRPISYTVEERMQNVGTPTVHRRCRGNGLWVAPPGYASNIAVMKARLCCRMNDETVAGRLQIQTSRNGSPVVYPEPPTQQSSELPGGDFAVPMIGAPVYPSPSPPNPFPPGLDFFAFALVSHGLNGEGAFIYGNPARRAFTVNVGNSERDNATDNITIRRDLPLNFEPGANYFDDVVFWRTNRSMFAEIGDGCNRP